MQDRYWYRKRFMFCGQAYGTSAYLSLHELTNKEKQALFIDNGPVIISGPELAYMVEVNGIKTYPFRDQIAAPLHI